MSDGPAGERFDGARARRRRESQRVARRSAALTVFGTLVPGSGLLRTRYYRLGWLALAAFVLTVLAAVGAVVLRGPTGAALDVAVRPNALLIAAGALTFAGAMWVFTIILTHRGTDHPLLDRSQRVGLRLFTALMCLLVAVPMGTAVRYSLIQRDLVDTLFDRPPAPREVGDPPAAPGEGPDPWAGVGRVNLLLLGSDAGTDRIGTRTDSMIVASVDAASGETLMFSLPRNLQNAPIPSTNPLSKLWPKGYNCGDPCLLNALWTEAENHRELFKNERNPGLRTIRDSIETILGLPVDYTIIVDLQGFQSLIDAMGGVTVTIRERLPVGGHLTSDKRLVGVDRWLEPGTRHLDGEDALWFARSRYANDDYSRMRRQRCLVGKILDQVNPATMLRRYPEIARAAADNISTDIPADDLPAWVEMVGRIQRASIKSLAFTDLNISPANPNYASIKRMVNLALHPELATLTPTTSAAPTPTRKTPTRTNTRTTTGPTTSSPTSTPTTPTKDVLVDVDEAC